MEYISIGSSCSIAYQLQQHNLKNCAYPFDWIRTNRLSYINELLNNNFEDFDKIEYVKDSIKFPLIDDTFTNQLTKTIVCKNKYSTFYHDFTDINNISIQYEKYIRRIDRLYNIIKSDKYICFIRDELKPNNLSIDDIINFDITVKNINPNIKYKLIIILHNSKYIIDENMICSNVQIIYDNSLFEHWTRPNIDWTNILNNY